METISNEYLQQQIQLHMNPNYGVASLHFAPIIAKIINANNFSSLTDYGSGKNRLATALRDLGVNLPVYQPYDPAFPEYGLPKAGDLVCCVDVLEHIEPDRIDLVIAHLHSLTLKAGFFSIHSGPAAKTLSDGRNAHLTQMPTSFWLPKLGNFFEIQLLNQHNLMGKGFWVIAIPRVLDNRI
jgi:hypothetical protein